MKEKDKGWRHSAKLQAALIAGIIIICAWVTNLHDDQIVLRVLAIAEAVVITALGGHVSMSIGQMITDRLTQSQDQKTYRIDPKDADDPTIP